MSVSEDAQRAEEWKPSAAGAPAPDAPLALEVRDVRKVFRIPEHRIDTFKERFVHPFSKPEFRELKALDGVSFDVRKGEFMGIVGRNGSGKSTLLKILASIYRADAGTIRMAGRLAPFIELGVGFNADLSARENVVLNAVMMGLSPREARTRIDAVFEFAELQEFRELKLKNYSSGMTVRLAFSVMLQADADVLLIDEVLAVGDASFQQKCADVFHDMRDSGKTVVLVTHDMFSVQTYCDRAMLLHDGKLIDIGDPEEIGKRYIRLNFSTGSEKAGALTGEALPDLNTKLIEAKIRNEEGEAVTAVEQGAPIHLDVTVEARRELVDPVFAIHCKNADGVRAFSIHRHLDGAKEAEGRRLPGGERIRISIVVSNQLTPGRYFLECWTTSHDDDGKLAVGTIDLLDFVIFGTARELGVFYVKADVSVRPEGEAG